MSEHIESCLLYTEALTQERKTCTAGKWQKVQPCPPLFLLGIWATWSTKGSRLINPMNATPESCSFLQSQQMEWDHTARDKRTSISLISKFQNIFRWLLLFFQRGSSISRLPYSDLLFIVMLQRVFVVVFHKKSKMGNVIEAEQGNLAAKHGQWLPYSPLCVRHMRSTLTLNRRVLNQKVTKKP